MENRMIWDKTLEINNATEEKVIGKCEYCKNEITNHDEDCIEWDKDELFCDDSCLIKGMLQNDMITYKNK